MGKNIFNKFLIIQVLIVFFFCSISNAKERIDFLSDLTYIGAFKLPNEYNGEHKWEYGGNTLGFYPMGDKDGQADGYPGSLYSSSNSDFVSEFSIPVPVNSTDLNKLNSARTLTTFYDITEGKLASTLSDAQRKQFNGITYIGPKNQQENGKLYWTFWSAYNVNATNYPSHGYSDPDNSNSNSQGPWNLEGYHNKEVAGYMFDIPDEWADANLNGKYIASGISREGGAFARGPALFATAPYKFSNSSSPPDNELPTVALIYYNQEHDGYPNYIERDSWGGGSWLTADNKEAVIFVGTKCLGDSCYGNGDECNDPCAASKGYHCYPKQPQMVLYDTSELTDVAKGLKKPWEVKPYQIINLLDHIPLFEECTGASGATYDRINNHLYIIQSKGDGTKPLVHVFKVKGEEATEVPGQPQEVTIKESKI